MKKKLTMNTKVKYKDSEKYQKHFSLDDRIKIQKIITENKDENGKLTILLKDIGSMMQKDPSSISKEVKLHRIFKKRTCDSMLKAYNSICSNYDTCKKRMGDLYNPNKYSKNIIKCVDKCTEFQEYICPNLKKFPWVCNGCLKAHHCHLNKAYYYSDLAHKDYRLNLVEPREGISISADEFKILNHTVSEQVKAGQPIYHIISSNELPVCQRTIYNYFEKGYFDVKNIDLRRKVAYKKRYKAKEDKTLLRRIKQGRKYEDYLQYVKMNPDASIVQMDTIISAEGSNKVLLTLHFVKYHFQLAYILSSKEVCNITATLNHICDTIGIEDFKNMFEVILTDNGVEFSDPDSIEIEPETGEIRSHVFFCHPYSSGEKGHCEKNHEYIRYILPKGTVFEFLTQDKVNLMMSHINSTIRPSVKGSPYDYMALTYGTEILDKLNIKKIDYHFVKLSPQLLNR